MPQLSLTSPQGTSQHDVEPPGAVPQVIWPKETCKTLPLRGFGRNDFPFRSKNSIFCLFHTFLALFGLLYGLFGPFLTLFNTKNTIFSPFGENAMFINWKFGLQPSFAKRYAHAED